jgi:hypothetical protein
MQTQIELAGSLGYIDDNLVRELMTNGGEVARLINGLVSALGRGKTAIGTLAANSANRAKRD